MIIMCPCDCTVWMEAYGLHLQDDLFKLVSAIPITLYARINGIFNWIQMKTHKPDVTKNFAFKRDSRNLRKVGNTSYNNVFQK